MKSKITAEQMRHDAKEFINDNKMHLLLNDIDCLSVLKDRLCRFATLKVSEERDRINSEIETELQKPLPFNGVDFTNRLKEIINPENSISEKKEIDWQKLRQKFFRECTDSVCGMPVVDATPHYVFEWFKLQIINSEK